MSEYRAFLFLFYKKKSYIFCYLGKKWGDFSVIKVVQYGSDLVYPDPTVSRLSDSTDVLALPLGLSLPLLALLVITTITLIYCAWRRRWCKRNK